MYIMIQISFEMGGNCYRAYGPMSKEEATILEPEAKRVEQKDCPQHRVYSWLADEKPGESYNVMPKSLLLHELEDEKDEHEEALNRIKEVLSSVKA